MLLGMASDLNQLVLRTDVAGMPLEWIDYREAIRLYHSRQVAYSSGSRLYTTFGGYAAATGIRSSIEVNSIISTRNRSKGSSFSRDKYMPPLNNRTLFKRDAGICLYCGINFEVNFLTRDHITPLSKGGLDVWTNVATACRRCNNHKGGRTPEEATMQLIAVPFTPTYAEYIYLKGRHILADQMQFLLAHMPRTSPLHTRIKSYLDRSNANESV
ncbi:MAG: HNH endonuclease [Woeseiaceae bacterium]